MSNVNMIAGTVALSNFLGGVGMIAIREENWLLLILSMFTSVSIGLMVLWRIEYE